MRLEQLQLAKSLLTAVMSGERCAELAAARSVSETHARRLCLELVGLAAAAGRLEFASAEDLKSLKRLRRHHARRVIEAIAGFEGPVAPNGNDLGEADIAAGVERLKARSRQPLRDVAMLCLLMGTGMRPTEIVQLRVIDCIDRDGAVREQIEVRGDIAVHGKARTVCVSSQRLVAALDAHVRCRAAAVRRRGGGTLPYRGLDPDAAVFQMDRGGDFKVMARPGGGAPISPRAFEAFAQIFIDAGWPGLSSTDVRRRLRRRLIAQQAPRGDVAAMLGVSAGTRGRRPPAEPKPLSVAAMNVV
jgi:integrase